MPRETGQDQGRTRALGETAPGRDRDRPFRQCREGPRAREHVDRLVGSEPATRRVGRREEGLRVVQATAVEVVEVHARLAEQVARHERDPIGAAAAVLPQVDHERVGVREARHRRADRVGRELRGEEADHLQVADVALAELRDRHAVVILLRPLLESRELLRRRRSRRLGRGRLVDHVEMLVARHREQVLGESVREHVPAGDLGVLARHTPPGNVGVMRWREDRVAGVRRAFDDVDGVRGAAWGRVWS